MGRRGEQRRIWSQVGLHRQQRAAQGVTSSASAGIGQRLPDPAAHPPSVQRADLRPLHLAIQRVGQPGLHAPALRAHLDETPCLGLLYRCRIGQPDGQRYAQRLAEGQYLEDVSLGIG